MTPARAKQASRPRRRALLLLLVVLLGLAAPPAPVDGAEPEWSSEPYSVLALGQDLAELLRDFAASQGLSVVIGEGVAGQAVRGRFTDLPPREFLDRIARTYGLVWWFDGNALHVEAANRMTSRIIQLRNVSVAELRSTLESLRIWDDRFGWRVDPGLGIVFVSGPEGYVELVAETAELLETTRTSTFEVAVFPLRYAWVDDRTFVVRDREITIPGIATMLSNVIAGRDLGFLSGTQQRRIVSTVRRLRGLGLVEAEMLPPPGVALGPGADIAVVEQDAAPETVAEAVIQADPRLNAVIIKDVRERLDLYEDLIEVLDVPARLVEIEVAIIDVNSDRLAELGVDWRLEREGSAAFDINVGEIPGGGGGVTGIETAETGLTIATILTGDPYSFLARVRALEAVGEAQVLSRPSVLTFDNVQAVFDRSEEFFVRVAGVEEVDLFSVTAGTLLRVTPHVIASEGREEVQLLVDVEDGAVRELERVDDIPTVERSVISTQGIVADNQALLIGGFYREAASSRVNKVPVLGDIPVIGWALFRSKETEYVKVMRLFLIRPNVVPLTADRVPPAADPLAPVPAPALPEPLVPPVSSAPLPATPTAAVSGAELQGTELAAITAEPGRGAPPPPPTALFTGRPAGDPSTANLLARLRRAARVDQPWPDPGGSGAAAPVGVDPYPAANGALYRVQLASVRDEASAWSEWRRLQANHPDLLRDLQPYTVRTDRGPGRGVYYGVQAGPVTGAAARTLCEALERRQQPCVVIRL